MQPSSNLSIEHDLRKKRRLSISAPVVFHWRDVNGGTRREEGITRDIAAEGVFIWAEILPAMNVSIECEIFMPKIRLGGTSVRVRMKGHTVRVSELSDAHSRRGFVVVSDHTVMLSQSGETIEQTGSSLRSHGF